MSRLLISFVVLLAVAADLAAGPEAVVVGQGRVDFGKYPAKDRKEARYQLKNKGDAPLKILGIRKNCACAEAVSDKTVIASGETAFVTAAVLGGAISGRYDKSIFIETDDPANKVIGLGISGEAVPVAVVKPASFLAAGRLELGKPWTQSFEIVPTGEALELGELAVKCNYALKAALVKAADGRYRLDLGACPDSASGDMRCEVSIPVRNPAGWRALDIFVSAQVGVALHALPAAVFLRNPGEGGRASSAFEIRRLGGSGPLKAEDVSVEAPDGVEVKLFPLGGATLSGDLRVSQEFISSLPEKGGVPVNFTLPGAAGARLLLKRK